MQAKLYNMQGDAVGTVELNPALFNVPSKAVVVQRAVLAQQANSKVTVAHAKKRGEVRGGGKKPWKQKGTGRARHGSIRSPLWIGGGVTFGPQAERNFAVKMNKKEQRKALFMTLTAKAEAEHVLVLDDLTLPEIKTKTVAALFKKLPVANKKSLLVQPSSDAKVYKSVRNLARVTPILADSLNIVDVLRHEYLVLPKSSLEVLAKTFHAAS